MTTDEALAIIKQLEIQNKNGYMVTMSDIAQLVRATDHINAIYRKIMTTSKEGE